MEKFKIKKIGNQLKAFDLIDKKRSYGSMNIKTGKFVGDTRCLLALDDERDKLLSENGVVTILDFTSGEVHIYNYPKTIENIEDWILETTEHSLSNIQYMCTDTLILVNNVK
jgi:hypothetical protein